MLVQLKVLERGTASALSWVVLPFLELFFACFISTHSPLLQIILRFRKRAWLSTELLCPANHSIYYLLHMFAWLISRFRYCYCSNMLSSIWLLCLFYHVHPICFLSAVSLMKLLFVFLGRQKEFWIAGLQLREPIVRVALDKVVLIFLILYFLVRCRILVIFFKGYDSSAFC